MASLPQAIVFSKNALFFTFIILTMLLSCSKDSTDQLATNDLNTIQAKMKSNNTNDNAISTVNHDGREIKVNGHELLKSAMTGEDLLVGEGECDCKYEIVEVIFIEETDEIDYCEFFANLHCTANTLAFAGQYFADEECIPDLENVDTWTKSDLSGGSYNFNCVIPTFSEFHTTFSAALSPGCIPDTPYEFAQIKFRIKCKGILYPPNSGCTLPSGGEIPQTIYTSDIMTITLNEEFEDAIGVRLTGCGCEPRSFKII